MRTIVTDVLARSVGCLSVCRSVYHDRESCKNGWTDRDAVWVWTRVSPRKHVLDVSAHWRNLANTIEPSMYGSDAALCLVTLTTCLYWQTNQHGSLHTVQQEDLW